MSKVRHPSTLTTTKRGVSGACWFDPIYKVSFVGLRCAPAQIKSLLTRHVSHRAARALLLRIAGQKDWNGLDGSTICSRSAEWGVVVLVWLSPSADTTTVAHEAFHAAFYVLEQKGLTISFASEEAVAYYLGWIVQHLSALGVRRCCGSPGVG